MDKERICLDSTILIDYYRKQDKSNTKFVQLSKKYSFSISVITKLEILVGINEKQRHFWENVFRRLDILPLGESDVHIAAEIIRALTKQNKIIGLKDILIASTAISWNLRLSTLNLKDFRRVGNLDILDE